MERVKMPTNQSKWSGNRIS